MEFWGVELKGDKPVKVVPSEHQVVHLSQATLAELKKSEIVTLYAKIGGQKLVIGLLSADNYPQLSFDLVFEKEVELSHNWKNGSVHLTGYKSLIPDDDDEEFSDYSEDEALALEGLQNGVAAAPAASNPKPAAPVAKKDNKPKEGSDDDDEDDDSDDNESDDSDDDESDEAMADGDEDDDSEDDSSDDEEETPVKSTGNKKRPAAATKTPEPKKAKIVTPQKTDGKKNVSSHIATPHPAKNAKTPKSGGSQTTCGSCKKTFNSQGALDSHTKAKHSAAK